MRTVAMATPNRTGMHKGNLPEEIGHCLEFFDSRSVLLSFYSGRSTWGMGTCRRGTRAGLSHTHSTEPAAGGCAGGVLVMTRVRGKILSAGRFGRKLGFIPDAVFLNSCVVVSNLGSPFKVPRELPCGRGLG